MSRTRRWRFGRNFDNFEVMLWGFDELDKLIEVLVSIEGRITKSHRDKRNGDKKSVNE